MTSNYEEARSYGPLEPEQTVVDYLAYEGRIFWSHRDSDGEDCYYDSVHDTVIQLEHVCEIAEWQINQWDETVSIHVDDLKELLQEQHFRPINLDPERYYPNQGQVVFDRGMWFVNAWYYSEANQRHAPEMAVVQ